MDTYGHLYEAAGAAAIEQLERFESSAHPCPVRRKVRAARTPPIPLG